MHIRDDHRHIITYYRLLYAYEGDNYYHATKCTDFINPSRIMATLQSQLHSLKQTVHSYSDSDSAQTNKNLFTQYNSVVGL